MKDENTSSLPQKSDLPTSCFDWKGKEKKMPYPSGGILLAHCQYASLWRTGTKFAVVYGLQRSGGLSRDAAAKEFGQCCFHQATCDGLMD